MRQPLTKIQLTEPIFLLFSLLLLLYGARLWQQSQPDTQANSRSLMQVAAVTYRGDNKTTSEAATRFSQAFGISPFESQVEAVTAKKIETLADLNPKLIAVDEVRQQLTARIVLNEGQNRLKNVRLGDELAGYKLTDLTLTKATFRLVTSGDSDSNLASTITLEVFTQAESEETAVSYNQ